MTSVQLIDQGELLTYRFEDLMRYHGPLFPGGVAHAFKVLERRCRCWRPTARPNGARSGWSPRSGAPVRGMPSSW